MHHALLYSSFGRNGPHLSHVFIFIHPHLFFFFSSIFISFFCLKKKTLQSRRIKSESHPSLPYSFYREHTLNSAHARLVSSSSSGQQLTGVISLFHILPTWPPHAFIPFGGSRLTHVGRLFQRVNLIHQPGMQCNVLWVGTVFLFICFLFFIIANRLLLP